MGWRLHRVWSTEWFYERERAIEGVVRSIEAAQNAPIEHGVRIPEADHASITAPQSTKAGTVVEPTRTYSAGEPYAFYRPSRRLDRDTLLQPTRTADLAKTVGEMVAVEGPIHIDVLIARLKDVHGVERAGTNVLANIKAGLRQAIRWGSITHDRSSVFYYPKDSRLVRFRVPSDGMTRTIEQIAPEELALATLFLIEDQFGVSEDRTPSAVARLLGTERLSAENGDLIRKVIDDLVQHGVLRRSGTQLYLGKPRST
jgi:hypothetical protein